MKSCNPYIRAAALTLALGIGITILHGETPPAQNAPAKTTGEHTPFITSLLKNFDAWDTNHDGTLSIEEINAAVTDPKNKGDDAAAAAAVKLLSRNKKIVLPPLTRAYFADYDARALALLKHAPAMAAVDAVSATVDSVASGSTTRPAARSAHLPIDFDLYFTASKERIVRGGPVPFTGRFNLDHARQGPLGDCFLVSSVTSFAYHDPKRFAKLITLQNDGSYVVQLPSAKPIEVPAPTDAELAISSTTAGDGVWLAVMEQAFGKYRAMTKGESEDVEGTELIRAGGDSMPTIHALTGHKAIRFSFGKTVAEHKTLADEMLPKLRMELIASLGDHRVICAGVAGRTTATDSAPAVAAASPLPKLPPDIISNHVYAVLSYDPVSDIVEIWNPHGQHFEPKGSAGPIHGYPTDHGRFKLPLAEAFAFYSSFTFEGTTP